MLKYNRQGNKIKFISNRMYFIKKGNMQFYDVCKYRYAPARTKIKSRLYNGCFYTWKVSHPSFTNRIFAKFESYGFFKMSRFKT